MGRLSLDADWKMGSVAQQYVLLAALAISVGLVLRWPELSAILVSVLSRFPQFLDLSARFDAALILRNQFEPFQNLSTQILAKGEWIPVEIRTRSLPFGIKVKYVLMVVATNISVIVPTLNEEKYLPRCLGSLINQSWNGPFEIIVVDGGSTDGTVQVAKKYADKVLIKRDQPVGAARNIGSEEAKGEVLAFIDADTIASVDWLEEIAKMFRVNPRAVGVTGPTLPYEGTRFDRLAYHIATGWAQRLSLRLGRPHVAGFNCAYRRDSFWDAGGFDENRALLEDVILSLRMRHQGQILFNPEMIAYTSLRRIKKYGYLYLVTYNIINWATVLFFNRTLAYPQVR